MKLSIPAKTFILGEYLALRGGSSLVLKTKPHFEFTLKQTTQACQSPFHPDSPAGQYIQQQAEFFADKQLTFFDPYQGAGGLGASTAQFIGVFKAYHQARQLPFNEQSLLNSYLEHAYNGQGLAPSGHDVLAQAQASPLSLVNTQVMQCEARDWPLPDLTLALLRTNKKLATHHHLAAIELTHDLDHLQNIVDKANSALNNKNTDDFIEAINHYGAALNTLSLVAPHTQTLLNTIQQEPAVLATKGCGALGADIILLAYRPEKKTSIEQLIKQIKLPRVF